MVPLVISICTFPKANSAGNALPDGGTPTPLKLTACVCNAAPVVSLTIILADRLPNEPGVNLTAIMQLEPTARLVVQVLAGDWKSAALVPVKVTPVKVSGSVPTLVNVTDIVLLLAPICTVPKPRLLGDTRAKTSSTAPISNPPSCGLILPKKSWSGAPTLLAALIVGEPALIE